jgi:hypothetical protein
MRRAEGGKYCWPMAARSVDFHKLPSTLHSNLPFISKTGFNFFFAIFISLLTLIEY